MGLSGCRRDEVVRADEHAQEGLLRLRRVAAPQDAARTLHEGGYSRMSPPDDEPTAEQLLHVCVRLVDLRCVRGWRVWSS